VTGFVTELAADWLALNIHSFPSAAKDQDTHQHTLAIKIMLNADQSFTFEGPLTNRGGDAPFILRIHQQDQQDRLRDLLGQIRKTQHIEICQQQDVEASDRFTGFQQLNFIPEALPDLDCAQLNTEVSVLGRTFRYPLLITGMTGGVEQGTMINRRLAQAAAHFGIPMGIGSQRIALENPEYAPIFDVKRWAPDLFLIGNLGFAQLLQPRYLDICQKAVDMIQADALAIHLNGLQEAVQVEGDRQFSGVTQRLEQVCAQLSVPVIIKEVGSGISPNTARRLVECGISAIDVGGRGGTSWGYIEGLRSASTATQSLGETFRDWGIPTAYSLAAIRSEQRSLPLFATGGVRDGLTVAKAVALGAQLVGIGLPLLRAALHDEDGPTEELANLIRGLETTMLATGSQSLSQLERSLCLGQPLAKSFEHWVTSKSFY
jgi:isopentenyl-diphosphate delta-isomerase